MVLHTTTTMFPKPHFIHCIELAHTKIAYNNYVLKIVDSKLASFNSSFYNERASKLKTKTKQKTKKQWLIGFISKFNFHNFSKNKILHN